MELVYGQDIDLSKADVFTMKNEHSYAAFVGVLSNIFMKAHASSCFRNNPYTAALVIDPLMTKPYNKQPESSLERIKAILSRMIDPSGRIDISIYVGSSSLIDLTSKVGLKHCVSQCWHIKKLGSPKHITGNVPPAHLNKGENIVRYFKQNQVQQFVDRFIDYNTPIASVFDILDESKTHISYQGGTAWLSVAMNIPTLIVHPTPPKNLHHYKSRLFGQDLGNVNILRDNKIVHVRQHPKEHHIHIKQIKQKLEKP